MKLRSERWKWARKGPQRKAQMTVSPMDSGSSVGIASEL
jgi:hypothetical protein